MIPSVQERKKNVHAFMNSYPHLCKLHNTIPNPNIKIESSNNVLDFVGDRLKSEDWKPLLEAISNDRSLHFISIRSRHMKVKVVEGSDGDTQASKSSSSKASPLFASCILLKLTEALSKCLSNSSFLTGLVLERIPLNVSAVMQLTQGLEVCQNLQQLSLPYTQIGDDQCYGLCHVLRHRLNLVWLNLTGCCLTDKGVGSLCNLLKFQKLNRYGESWKQSLRYRPVNPNIMPGLRRLTLNHNPIGDAGVQIFVDTLIDDLWLKALDLQHCNVTMVGGEALLGLVRENKFLTVVDVRNNMQVPNNLVAAIVQQLAENNKDTTAEFQWLKEDNPKSRSGMSQSGTSISRSTRRQLSTTTISSNALSSLLPSKMKLAQSLMTPISRARSASAKRTITNNTPRLPWNCNLNNIALKRGNSDQLIRTNSRNKQDIFSELNAVKKQLIEVSELLSEERERRSRIEEELEKYKNLLELPDSSNSVDTAMLQKIFCQVYNAYLNKQKSESPKPEKKVTENKYNTSMKKHDSLESVIRTINGENHPEVQELKDCNSSVAAKPSTDQSDIHDNPSRAQLLFESLILS